MFCHIYVSISITCIGLYTLYDFIWYEHIWTYCNWICYTRVRVWWKNPQDIGGCPLPKSGWLIPPVAPRIPPKLGPWQLLDAGLLARCLWHVMTCHTCHWSPRHPSTVRKMNPCWMPFLNGHVLHANPFGQSSSQPRFSGAFDIHCFASAKKLTKWAAAFDRGRAHVVMQCDSVQSLQRILGTIRTSEPKSLLGWTGNFDKLWCTYLMNFGNIRKHMFSNTLLGCLSSFWIDIPCFGIKSIR